MKKWYVVIAILLIALAYSNGPFLIHKYYNFKTDGSQIKDYKTLYRKIAESDIDDYTLRRKLQVWFHVRGIQNDEDHILRTTYEDWEELASYWKETTLEQHSKAWVIKYEKIESVEPAVQTIFPTTMITDVLEKLHKLGYKLDTPLDSTADSRFATVTDTITGKVIDLTRTHPITFAEYDQYIIWEEGDEPSKLTEDEQQHKIFESLDPLYPSFNFIVFPEDSKHLLSDKMVKGKLIDTPVEDSGELLGIWVQGDQVVLFGQGGKYPNGINDSADRGVVNEALKLQGFHTL